MISPIDSESAKQVESISRLLGQCVSLTSFEHLVDASENFWIGLDANFFVMTDVEVGD